MEPEFLEEGCVLEGVGVQHAELVAAHVDGLYSWENGQGTSVDFGDAVPGEGEIAERRELREGSLGQLLQGIVLEAELRQGGKAAQGATQGCGVGEPVSGQEDRRQGGQPLEGALVYPGQTARRDVEGGEAGQVGQDTGVQGRQTGVLDDVKLLQGGQGAKVVERNLPQDRRAHEQVAKSWQPR